MENYTFGPGIPVQAVNNISSSRECFDACYKKDNCTHFSWDPINVNSKQNSCLLLTSTNDIKINDIKSIQYFCQKEGSILTRREFLCQKSRENSDPWIVTKTHKLKGSARHPNVTLAQCWRDICKPKNCSFFSWNPDKKECSISNGNTEICVTPKGSECSQIIEEVEENFVTVRANNCTEKNMTDDSGRKLMLALTDLGFFICWLLAHESRDVSLVETKIFVAMS